MLLRVASVLFLDSALSTACAISGVTSAGATSVSETCPIFRSQRDAELTKRIYQAAPVLIREDEAGNEISNPWGIKFKTMFHMSNDSHLFRTRKELQDRGLHLGEDSRFRGNGETWLPLYEAKMIHQYDHRFATYESIDGSERTRDVTLAEHQNPNYSPLPRYWVREEDVEAANGGMADWFLGFRDIARNTDERTAIFSLLPWSAVANSLPILQFDFPCLELPFSLVANLSTFVFDFAVRQKVGGTHLNFFIVKQLPVLGPSDYNSNQLTTIASKVVALSSSSTSLKAITSQSGSSEWVFEWIPEERLLLRTELDAIYAHLYGLSREDFTYILDTFPIVQRKDQAAYGEYRTKRLCLEAYDRLAGQL